MTQPISIIMPVLNEGDGLEATLQSLQPLRARGHEVIVADGGSRDRSLTIARRNADRVVMSGAGRALQMNAGAEYAKHEILLFLHADTQLPEAADALVQAALAPQAARWGRFDLRLDHPHPVYRLIETSINWRSHISGVATGDQAIFVEREYFERVGCYDRLPLMEDVTLSKKLLHFARPARITTPVVSSARRWEQGGVLRTILLMWQLRTAFFFGADPFRLAERYRPHGSDEA
jgi:rSAM/selenodomain-associated transferase 2